MKAPSFFLIVNPIAGHRRGAAVFPEVRRELERRKAEFDYYFTNEPMEAADIAKMVIEKGYTQIVAMGGDGTINEVVNGMIELGCEMPLGVIPTGNGNDFARMHGIPLSPLDAISVLFSGRNTVIDLGYVEEDRYFVNGIGIGIDAQVARDVLLAKRLRGAPAYYLSAVRQVLSFHAFSVSVSVAGDDCCKEHRLISLGIANGKYAGGGFQMAPRAKTNDGLLDLCAIEDMPVLKRLVSLPLARRGGHIGLSEVDYRQAPGFEVSSPTKLIAHMDGEEHWIPKPSFRVSVAKSALQVLIPR